MTNTFFRLAPLGMILGGVFLFSSAGFSDGPVQPSTQPTERRDLGMQRSGPLVYARKEERVTFDKPCTDLARALEGWDFFGTPYSDTKLDEAWKPWSGSDVKVIEGCDHFPCDAKLDAAEVAAMSASPKSERKKTFFSLVAKRVSDYQAKDLRREYEFPGALVDPWQKILDFEQKARANAAWSFPTAKEKKLFSRYHRFTDDSYRPLRQVFDVRATVGLSKEGTRMTWVVRDAYTEHYFDGWGELLILECENGKKSLTLTQGLLMEFDLYKKTDFFSKFSQGTMTRKLEELSAVYQRLERDSLFGRLGIAPLATPRPNY